MSKEGSIKKFKHYLSASFLTTIAGVITFPVLTRILSKADYGAYSLIQGIQLIYEAIVKFGGQLSVMRFYPDMMQGNSDMKNAYITNIFIFPLFLSFCISGFLILMLIVYSIVFSPVYIYVLVIVTAQASILLSFFHSYMQASGQSRIDALISVLNKYLYLILVIPTVMYLLSDFWGVYWSICVSSLVTCMVVVYLNRGVFSGVKIHFDFSYVKKSIKYSFPLFLTEISAISMSFVDRFVMAIVDVDMEMIGVYAIGVGLANVLFLLVWKTIQPLVFPRINEIHDNKSLELSVAKLGEASNFYLLLVVSVCTGVYLNCEDFLVVISGRDKIDAAIFFFFGISILLFKLLGNFLYYGFDLNKETNIIFKSELLISMLNLALNLLLIPLIGIYGAVISSLVSIPCGMLYKSYNLNDRYRIKGLFSGFINILFLLIVYSLFHIFFIESFFDNEFIRLILSVLVFVTVFFIGRRIWIGKFYKVFLSDEN